MRSQLNLVIVDASPANIFEVAPTLKDEICMAQQDDSALQHHVKRTQEGKTQDLSKDDQGTLRF